MCLYVTHRHTRSVPTIDEEPTFLADFLKHAPFPEPLLSLVLEKFALSHAEDLAYNRSLGSSATALVGKQISPKATIFLIESGNLEVLRAILNSKEKRGGVLDAIDRAWSLCQTDQLLFAARPFQAPTAQRYLESTNYSDTTKLLLLPKIKEDEVFPWLYKATCSDDEILNYIETARPIPRGYHDSYIPVLLARPALRSRALHSSYLPLFRDACWMELTKEDQTYAASRASADLEHYSPSSHYRETGSQSALHAAFGLLSRPSLLAPLRADLWDQLAPSCLSFAINDGIRLPGSASHVGVPLAELTDPAAITLLLEAALTPADEATARDTQIVSLVALSDNPALDDVQRRTIIYALAQHINAASLRHVEPLTVILKREVDAIGGRGALAPYQLPYYADRALREMPPYNITPAESTATRHHYPLSPPPPIPDADLAALLGSSPAEIVRTVYRATSVMVYLVAPLVAALGTGESDVSCAAWSAFFTLAAREPDVPLSSVITTAKSMARAGVSDATLVCA